MNAPAKWMLSVALLSATLIGTTGCGDDNDNRRVRYRRPHSRKVVVDGRTNNVHHHYYDNPREKRSVHHHDYDEGRVGHRRPNRPRGERTVHIDIVKHDHRGRDHEREHRHHLPRGAKVDKSDRKADEVHDHHHHYGSSSRSREREREAERGTRKPVKRTKVRIRHKDGKVEEHRHHYHGRKR